MHSVAWISRQLAHRSKNYRKPRKAEQPHTRVQINPNRWDSR